jgi:hypothetical protein
MYVPNPDGGPMTTCTGASDANCGVAGFYRAGRRDLSVRSVTIRAAGTGACANLGAIEWKNCRDSRYLPG